MAIKYLDAKRIRGSSTATSYVNAGKFDGNDYCTIDGGSVAQYDIIAHSGDFTISCWIRHSTLTEHITILDRSNDGDDLLRIQYHASNATYKNMVVMHFDAKSWYGNVAIPDDTWVHVVVSRGCSSNTITPKIYVNGVGGTSGVNTGISQGSSTCGADTGSGTLRIGDKLIGALKDLAVYDEQLSDAQVLAIYNGGKGNLTSVSSYATDLVAHYPMSSNFNDTAGSGYNATASGDANIGQAIDTISDEKATLVDPYGTAEFDGSGDYARVNNSVLNNVTDDWTIAMWYKTDDLTTGDAVIGCYTTGGTAGWQIYQKENNLIISDGTNHARNNLTFTTGTWYHIAWVCTSGTLQMFVDGVVSNIALATGGGSYGSYAASQSYGHELDSPDNTLNFGQRGDNDKYFDGRLQDAGFWTRALSSADIVLLAAGTPIDKAALATTYTTGLQGYFKFNGNFNSEVNSYTGTASGNATTSTSGGEFNNASNLPENTLFEETDTRKIYGLESGAWNVWYGNPKIWASGNCTRGIIAGGSSPSSVSTIDYITIDTSSASSEFGDLLLAVNALTGVDNGTRAVFGGVTSLDMSYVTIATTGDALDFGDLNVAQNDPPIAGMRNHTRGIFAGGQCSGSSQTGKGIEFITIDTKGNGTTFGELTVSVNRCAGVSSEAGRGLRIGGSDCDGLIDSIDYITIATAGDATDYGDLGANLYYLSAASDGSRWVTLGGEDGNATNICKYGDIATAGNGTTFGNLTQSVYQACGISGTTRGVRIGGNTGSTHTDTMDYVVIQTVAGATDFGDLRTATKKAAGASGA